MLTVVNVKRFLINILGHLRQAVIRFHCSTLLGLDRSNKTFPPPATKEEKEMWLNEIVVENWTENETSEVESADSGVDEASQHLRIIQNFLHKHGIERFAPDFTQGVNSPENMFLWDVAVKILVRLVECGEYTGVCLTETPVETITFHLRKHVKDSLKRR